MAGGGEKESFVWTPAQLGFERRRNPKHAQVIVPLPPPFASIWVDASGFSLVTSELFCLVFLERRHKFLLRLLRGQREGLLCHVLPHLHR